MKCSLLFPFCFLFFAGKAQTVAVDSAYRPASYALKAEQFKSYDNHANDILFFGNSITAGTDWSELLGLPNAHNRGISGDITFGLLGRLDEITEGHPAKIFILIGINDISRNTPDSIILQNDLEIVRLIKAESPSTKIYFQTLLPTNNTFTKFKNHYNKDEHIKAVNEGLARIAEEEHITLVGLHDHFLDSEGKLNKEYTIDGLHLNAEGYEVWKKILQPYLK